MTGDIVDRGLPSEYEQARAIFGSSRSLFPRNTAARCTALLNLVRDAENQKDASDAAAS